jgi:MoaA/NifB/PqqE/SkfB family radical SAM enzyme
LSIVIDKRDRHQIREAADLAESLGCNWISFILPQPVPASADRSSDLDPEDWITVRDEVAALGREPHRRTAVSMDYGAPFEGDEIECDTMKLKRIYIDPDARVSLCCQLSDYGFNTRDITGDLNQSSLRDVYESYITAMDQLRHVSAPGACGDRTTIDAYPCLRCARSLGKLDWLEQFPASPWSRPQIAGVAVTTA